MSEKPEITKFGTISELKDGTLFLTNFEIRGNGSYEDPHECLLRLIIERLQGNLAEWSLENKAALLPTTPTDAPD